MNRKNFFLELLLNFDNECLITVLICSITEITLGAYQLKFLGIFRHIKDSTQTF